MCVYVGVGGWMWVCYLVYKWAVKVKIEETVNYWADKVFETLITNHLTLRCAVLNIVALCFPPKKKKSSWGILCVCLCGDCTTILRFHFLMLGTYLLCAPVCNGSQSRCRQWADWRGYTVCIGMRWPSPASHVHVMLDVWNPCWGISLDGRPMMHSCHWQTG